jgi:hypothetical protein
MTTIRGWSLCHDYLRKSGDEIRLIKAAIPGIKGRSPAVKKWNECITVGHEAPRIRFSMEAIG